MNQEIIDQSRATKVKRALEALINEPIQPGSIIKTEVFEDLLGIKRNTQTFGFLISEIRHALYFRGLNLSGEGHNGEAFEIGDPRDNYWVAKLAVARAERDFEGKLTLLKNTNTNEFSPLEVKRHENMVRELSLKLSAMRKAAEIDQLLKRRSAKEVS